MTDDMMNLPALVEKTLDADVVRRGSQAVLGCDMHWKQCVTMMVFMSSRTGPACQTR